MVLFSFKRSVFKHTHRDLVERSGAVTVNCQVKHQSGFWWFRAPDTFVTTFSPFIWHTDTLLGLYFCCFSCCCSVYLYLWWCCCFFFLKTLIDPIYVITGSLNWSWSFREMKSVIQHSDLFYSILFYSILFCHILLILFHLNVMFPGSQPWYYTLLDLRAIICRFWHVLRVDRGRLCGNGTRTDVPPFLLLLFPFERLPRRDDWHRAVRSANRRAPCRICIKRPHAIGLVRATANRLACHYRCLLLGGARGAR